MSRTTKSTKGCGYEYWGRRSVLAKGMRCPGRYTKVQTHRGERREEHRLIDQELVEATRPKTEQEV